MYVEALPPQHALAAVIRQPAECCVSGHAAVYDGEVQEVYLALGDAGAARLLRTTQQPLRVTDVGAQANTRPPAVLCGL